MLLKSQFFWRTYLGYLAIILLSTLALTILLATSARRNEIQTVDSNLHAQAQLLALSVLNPALNLNYQAISDQVAQFSEASGSRFTVIDANGLVLADSHESAVRMDNHFNRPEIQEALISGNGQALRYSATLNEEFRYYALPVFNNDRVLLFVRTAFSFPEISQKIKDQQLHFAKYASYIIFAGLLFSFYLAARQALIVDEIANVAEVVSNGDFEKRLSIKNTLGLGKLADVINQLARSSGERVALITADRNRFATIFAGMAEGVVDVDQEQRIIHMNEAAAKILGVSQLNSRGKLVWEVVRDNEIIQAIEQAIQTQSVIKTQTSFSRSATSIIDEGIVDIYAASLSDDSGEPVGAAIVLNDVTELKGLERVRTDFVANASHELKTPITAILGLSETILEDDGADRDTALQFMGRIHAQSIRLSQLVADLITISRLESSQVGSEFTKLNITDLLTRGVKTAEVNSEEKMQTLSLEMPEEAVFVYGDSQNLSQLIDNLIDNAIKYTPAGGDIKVALHTEADEVLLDIIDSGVGISTQYVPRVFERFYRVDKARSQSLGGTGLGLSIVKNIAERHGGAVSVKSRLGVGSTFTFRMKKTQR